MSSDIQIVDYTERSIAVFGDTRSYKEEFKLLGGRFNPRLHHDGVREAGWIFPKSKLEDVEDMLNNGSFDDTETADIEEELDDNDDVALENVPIPNIEPENLPDAIKDILSFKGKSFLQNETIINILCDYNAFNEHPALKNIYRILHNDGFIAKVAQQKSWNTTCANIVTKVVHDYCFPSSFVEYILKSICYGLGTVTDNPQLYTITAQTPAASNTPSSVPLPQNKPWAKMTEDEKNAFLESKLEIKVDTFKAFGISMSSYSIFYEEKDIHLAYELTGKMHKDDAFYVMCAIYDKDGKIKTSQAGQYIWERSYKGFYTVEDCFSIHCKRNDIGRIVIYAK